MKTDYADGRERYLFDSLQEVERYISATPRKWRRNASQQNDARQGWDLRAGYEGALELARNGWNEGAARVKQAFKALPPLTPAPREKVDFYGHRPHVPRFCAGAPDNMVRHAPDANLGSKSVLTLYCPINALGDVPAQAMANYGVAILHHVNQLELQGVSVELYAVICSLVRRVRVCHVWKCKSAGQPLNLSSVAFSIGHPAAFRRIGFALRERVQAPECAGYGESQRADFKDIIGAPVGAAILNGMVSADIYARTPESALEYVGQEIERALEQREAA